MIYNLLSKPLTILVGGNEITLECAGHLSLYEGNGALKIGCPGYKILSQLDPGDAIIVEEDVADLIIKFCYLNMTIVFTPMDSEPHRLKYRGIH